MCFGRRNNPRSTTPYATLPPAAYVLNFLGIFVVAFALIVGYLVTAVDFKRAPLPEESQLQIQMDETVN